MQAQSVNSSVQNITVSQSLAAVQTLLKAGLGCITYLRDLLPVDNFNESHFMSSSEDSTPSTSLCVDDVSDKKSRRNVSAFKIMTVTRGFTEEADKLLNYLEYGIFDALKKQYLRSFIFAVYLDNKDPNNIVEAYTFNFSYHTVPGTDTVVPIMNFNDNSGESPNQIADPITEAAKRGKPPTLGEVKKSVKSLLRRLVNATTQMDALPKRRYATFKLFYYGNTPPDYEPPHFLPGDAIKDRWFFTTHGKEELPEKWSLGGIETGYHGLNINITSIAGYLPSSNEDNDAVFAGITSRPPGLNSSSLTPAQEATLRARQIDVQMVDAVARNIVWGLEGDEDPDAEGELDDGYVLTADGTYERPIGLRKQDGLIGPIPSGDDGFRQIELTNEHNTAMDTDPITQSEALFEGLSETVPARVGDLNLLGVCEAPHLEQTQQISFTQELERRSLSPTTGKPGSPTPSSITDAFANINIATGVRRRDRSTAVSYDSIDIDTQILHEIAINGTTITRSQSDEISTANMSMISPIGIEEDQIESFQSSEAKNTAEDIIVTQDDGRGSVAQQPTDNFADNGLKCECNVSIEDECTYCEGGCGYWYHIWCMGFHSTSDKRIPKKFICFDCRVRADLNWDLIKVDLYPKMISKFKDLALFRRAIKIAEVYKPNNFARFAKLIGCDTVVARQLFKRLESEDFMTTEARTTDELGILETATRSSRNKAKPKGKQRKTLQKTKYIFNPLSTRTSAYKDYFNPDPTVESRVLRLADLKSSFKSLRKELMARGDDNTREMTAPPLSPLPASVSVNDTQTQEDTQRGFILGSDAPGFCENDPSCKRKSISMDNISRRPSKKVKISMGPAVDLGD